MKKFSTHVRLMLFLCSISLLALLAYRVPHLTAWQAQARVPATGTQLQILIPLYNYPNWYAPEEYIWDDVAAANSQVPITAIISPCNGPVITTECNVNVEPGDPANEHPNDDYVRGLSDLRDAGVTILGYVYTNEGNRPVTEVKAEIDLYDQNFNINGIFFDQAASDASKVDYYQELYDYVKSRANLDNVIINSGTNVDEGYIGRPASDTAVIFENNSTEWLGYQPSAYITNYPANRFAMLVHGVPDVATMQSHIDTAQKCNIGYVYLTDDTFENNPWDTLPSFWSEEVAYIQQINSTPNPNATCTPANMPTSTPSATHTPTSAPTSTSTPIPTPTSGEVQPQILIPLYNYPNWYAPDNYIWDDVAAANSQVPITGIINPCNGPIMTTKCDVNVEPGDPANERPNADYVRGLSDLRDAGVTIVGYVYTDDGNRPVDEVKAEVDLYDQHFNIDGIFFDQAASSASKLDYYGELYDYVKSRPNLDKVIINPGTRIDEGYISRPASDVAVIFANDSSQWATYQPSAYVANYPANRFAMLAYGVPNVATMQSHIELAKQRNIGYVYLTDDTLENNPWDSLPTFWQEEVAYIAQTPTPTPTSTMGPTATPDKSAPTPTATNTAGPSATPTVIPENALYLPVVIR